MPAPDAAGKGFGVVVVLCPEGAGFAGVMLFCHGMMFLRLLMLLFHRTEPWYHLPLILNFFKEVCAGADPVAVIAVHSLVDDGFLPRGLDGGEGHEAVEFSVAEVAVVFVHKFFWADNMLLPMGFASSCPTCYRHARPDRASNACIILSFSLEPAVLSLSKGRPIVSKTESFIKSRFR